MALLVVAGSCSSSDEDQPVDQSRRPGNAAEGYPLERALVACIQDNGIDAELLPDGSVSSKSGTLSREEWRALRELCFQRLEDQGFIVHEEPSDELTERTYNEYVSLRECLIDQGFAIPELASLESFAANPESVINFIDTAIREDPTAFVKAYEKCPNR